MFSTLTQVKDFKDSYLLLTNYSVYNLTSFLSFLGGLWTVISVVFGALIFSILRRNFWNKLAIKMIKRDEAEKKIMQKGTERSTQEFRTAINDHEDDDDKSEISSDDDKHMM